MVDENSANDIHLSSEVRLHLGNQSFEPQDKIDRCQNIHNMDYEDIKLEESSLSVDSQLSNVHLQNNFNKEDINYEVDNSNSKFDDSNSNNSLLVDEQLNNVSGPNSLPEDKQIYNLNMEHNPSLAYLSKDCFYCNICGKSYEQKSEFEEHYETHFYKCKICLAVFTNMDVLNSHRKEAHGTCVNDIKTVKTRLRRATVPIKNENGQKSDSASEESEVENDDSQIKAEEYDFSCPTCGKGFQCKSYLMVHQRVHSDVKPYPCTTCGQNFKTKQSLLDHTNRHLGVKPYMCEICGRGFITKGLCRAHQKVHSGLDNRKYSCKICSKMFVSKSYLQTHLRIHTGEKTIYVREYKNQTSALLKGTCKNDSSGFTKISIEIGAMSCLLMSPPFGPGFLGRKARQCVERLKFNAV
ncbi:hypothetical protein NQ318_006293 [Aromia moschata]|uniref:C2H2-type domain-containing protein n=1 Tax=Aromia moschata TaxID=1265417 RepID=A0AAV8YZ05_9CUCU|nr:hypothetical protein NQ318_006293 [Aromia moschata]